MSSSRARLVAATLVAAAAVAGCTDVGDSSAVAPQQVPGDDATTGLSADSPDASAEDAPARADREGSAGDGAPVDAHVQEMTDATEVATTAPESSTEVGQNAGGGDSGVDSTIGSPEAGGVDAAIRDAASDSTISDGSVAVIESGSTESGTDGSGGLAHDAAIEASSPDAAESGGGLVPCTMAGQQNCVQCQGNLTGSGSNGGLCSKTEALFVSYDIREGFATAAGPDPDGSCYTCLVNGGALDDTATPDTGLECEDLTGNFTAGNGFSGSSSDTCLATLACVLGEDCAVAASGGVSNCYCGAGGGTPSFCPSHGPMTDGACKTPEANGFLAQPDDAVTILNNYNDLSQPSGKANQFFVFAHGTCDQCLQ